MTSTGATRRGCSQGLGFYDVLYADPYWLAGYWFPYDYGYDYDSNWDPNRGGRRGLFRRPAKRGWRTQAEG